MYEMSGEELAAEEEYMRELEAELAARADMENDEEMIEDDPAYD